MVEMELQFKTVVCDTIEQRKEDLYDLSQQIWSKPELNFEEHFSHELLTTFLQNEGFEVRKSYPLDTAFVARYGNKEKDSLRVGICCEYDALPSIGHACGHNLIAEAGVAAALGLKGLLSKDASIKAEVIVYGTPAEEGGGGKVKMIEENVFDEADICMMSHPTLLEIPSPISLSVTQMTIVYHGKTSHAAAAPWEGINALDAAVACYNGVSMLRQQTKPTNRIHGIIIDGGDKPNIIPQRSEMNFYVRGLLDEDVKELKEKLVACAKGAATTTGCTVEFSEDNYSYSALKRNKVLAGLYVSNATSLGVSFTEGNNMESLGSTDMGNLSQIKPSIHPYFRINSEGPNHTAEFTKAAGAIENQLPTLNSAKSMAMAAVDIILNPKLLVDIREEFHKK